MEEVLNMVFALSMILMLVLALISLKKGSELSTYLKRSYPDIFMQCYGNGTLFWKSARNDIARVNFVHKVIPLVESDHQLFALRKSVKVMEVAYMVSLGVAMLSFFG